MAGLFTDTERRLRPYNDWILVRTEPLPEQSSVLYIPEKGRVYTAEVLAVGPRSLEIKTGERVAFLRWNFEHQQGKQIKSILEDLGADLGLIKEQDVLFVIPPGEEGTIA